MRGIELCAATEPNRLAGIEELAECLHEDPDPALDPTRWAELQDNRRWAMLTLGFEGGRLPKAAGERLVREGILSEEDARALADAPNAIRRLLAGEGPGFREVVSSACRLGARARGVDLSCKKKGACGGGCGMRWEWSVRIRLEHGRYSLVSRAHEPRDEANGTCGCCM